MGYNIQLVLNNNKMCVENPTNGTVISELAPTDSTLHLLGMDSYLLGTEGPFVAYDEDNVPLDVEGYTRSLLFVRPTEHTEQGCSTERREQVNQEYQDRFPLFVLIKRQREDHIKGRFASCEYKMEIRFPLLPPCLRKGEPLLTNKLQIYCKTHARAVRVQPSSNDMAQKDGKPVKFTKNRNGEPLEEGGELIFLRNFYPLPIEELQQFRITLVRGDYFVEESITYDNRGILNYIADQLTAEIEHISNHPDRNLPQDSQTPEVLAKWEKAENRLKAHLLDLKRLTMVLKTIDEELKRRYEFEN